MHRVHELMTTDVVSIKQDASLDDAMSLMDEGDFRHLPVVEGDRLVGVLSERDLLEATGWLPPRLREVLDAPGGTVEDFMQSPVVTVSPDDSIVTACIRLLEWGIGCLPVLDDRELIGMLADVDVLDAYAKACAGSLVDVESDPDVTELMSKELFFAEHDTPAEETLAFFHEKHIRHVPVQADGELMGLVSDRDLRLCIGRGQLEGTPIGELVAPRVVTVGAGTKMSSAARSMVRHRIGAVPVVEGPTTIGILSAVDILEHCTQAFADRTKAPEA